MNQEAVLNLLQNIYVHQLIGVASIDTVNSAIEKELVKRTAHGNFVLSDKGLRFLKGELKWDDL